MSKPPSMTDMDPASRRIDGPARGNSTSGSTNPLEQGSERRPLSVMTIEPETAIASPGVSKAGDPRAVILMKFCQWLQEKRNFRMPQVRQKEDAVRWVESRGPEARAGLYSLLVEFEKEQSNGNGWYHLPRHSERLQNPTITNRVANDIERSSGPSWNVPCQTCFKSHAEVLIGASSGISWCYCIAPR